MCNYLPSNAFCTQSYKLRPFVDPKNFCFLNKLNFKKKYQILRKQTMDIVIPSQAIHMQS